MTDNQNKPEMAQEETCEAIDMEHVENVIASYVAKQLNLTDEEIDERVKEVLRLTRMSCAAVKKMEQNAMVESEIELEDIGDNPARLYALLSREICIFDRYAKVHGDENVTLKLPHRDRIDAVREFLCGMKQSDDGALTQEDMKAMIRELMAFNAVYRCLSANMTGMLDSEEEADMNDDVFEIAMQTASVLNDSERGDLPDEYEDLAKTGGDMKEKIALRTCVLSRIYAPAEVPAQLWEPRCELSGDTKKLLLGAGAVGAAALLIFGPGSAVTKVCAGIAAVALGVCAASAMK